MEKKLWNQFGLKIQVKIESGMKFDLKKKMKIFSVPTGPPTNIQYEMSPPMDSGTVTIRFSWDPPEWDKKNGKITGYRLNVSPSDLLPDQGKQVKNEIFYFVQADVKSNKISYLFSSC